MLRSCSAYCFSACSIIGLYQRFHLPVLSPPSSMTAFRLESNAKSTLVPRSIRGSFSLWRLDPWMTST